MAVEIEFRKESEAEEWARRLAVRDDLGEVKRRQGVVSVEGVREREYEGIYQFLDSGGVVRFTFGVSTVERIDRRPDSPSTRADEYRADTEIQGVSIELWTKTRTDALFESLNGVEEVSRGDDAYHINVEGVRPRRVGSLYHFVDDEETVRFVIHDLDLAAVETTRSKTEDDGSAESPFNVFGGDDDFGARAARGEVYGPSIVDPEQSEAVRELQALEAVFGEDIDRLKSHLENAERLDDEIHAFETRSAIAAATTARMRVTAALQRLLSEGAETDEGAGE